MTRMSLIAMLLAVSGAAQAGPTVRGVIGARTLDGQTWEAFDADRQTAFGVQGDFPVGAGPLHLHASLLASGRSEDEDRVVNGVPVDESSVSVVDLALGLKLMPRVGTLRPYAAAGFSSTGVGAEYEDEFGNDEDDSDQAFGYWAALGGDLLLGERFHVGVEARLLRGFDEVELFGFEDEIDSLSVLGSFGYRWGD